ncbi:putative AAA-ATPase [Clostridium homopropionicum DSM 5847]|uniref:Putative AAA-ATPase n=1 Tax=Clostridium homopropionicum DSM 5847 TaxID=1121318 RepID=A0A0L6Z5D3_9CLOT|nr:AAA family ATPase [Clostridium homopropionicum]KOA18167.1 putative AAA-ATPase [Clostridium homopropionicum DSM 5847]SFG94572.1 Predicted AAA-ATPase [Clostridium homopropionicum]
MIIYIDKTEYIEKLENYHSPYIFFLRPRRFGKSLFTSILANYYDIKEEENFNKLFGETYIGKNPTKEKNSYYILKFNFTGLNTDTKEKLEETFISTIKESFDKFISDYKLNINYIQEGTAASIFESFLNKVNKKIDGDLYVIIDEYNHFANELLSFRTEMFSEIISKTGFVRKWYEVLKKGTESIVKRIFATGVSPITLDSFTSGFNIADNITRYEDFNEMIGFTEAEVRKLIQDTSHNDVTESELEELIDILKQNYNGYLFSEDSSTRLFNSGMILYYLKTYSVKKEGPKDFIDTNVASDYGKLGNLFDLKDNNRNMKVLDSILTGEETTAIITQQFSLEKDFNEDDFKSLLFYLGLLTIDRETLGAVILKVPNYAIKTLYFEYFNKKVSENYNLYVEAEKRMKNASTNDFISSDDVLQDLGIKKDELKDIEVDIE